ncbi:MAG: acyl carrier protein [Epsilonproteobacteria bacterium]|nr:MAG: acyl carrier protein [Campylobacterota bacterium]
METFNKIKELLASKTKSTVEMNSTLKDIGIDSLDLVEFVLEAEEIFGVRIDDEELMKFVTVKDVVEAINKRI